MIGCTIMFNFYNNNYGNMNKEELKYWETSAGKILKIKDMNTCHIINSINKIERSGLTWRPEYLPVLKEELRIRNKNVRFEFIDTESLKTRISFQIDKCQKICFLEELCGYKVINESDKKIIEILNNISDTIRRNKILKFIKDEQLCIKDNSEAYEKFLSIFKTDVINLDYFKFIKKYNNIILSNIFISEFTFIMKSMFSK